jgi:hypothetical protein
MILLMQREKSFRFEVLDIWGQIGAFSGAFSGAFRELLSHFHQLKN